MKKQPLQMVVIDLENGRRGVFVGRPLVPDDWADDDFQVENVWFTDVQQIPEGVTLEQITDFTLDQVDYLTRTRQ